MEPFEHINNLHTKYHELMLPCFDHWLKLPKQKFDAIDEAMHTCMTWTMLIDDIQDESYYRFGVPSAHRAFGVALTLNAANNNLVLAQKQLGDMGNPASVDIFWRVFKEFFYGQGIDMYWREKQIIPTEDAHLEMTKKKSGSWFAFPVEVMQLFSSNKTDYSELGYWIGAYYTMLDDYYNLFQPSALDKLSTTEKRENYAPANDITESKITLAIIHASQFPDVAPELADILKQRSSDLNVINRALSLIKKHDSDKYVRNVLKNMEGEIRAEIDRLGGNPKLKAYMDDLSL